MENLLANKLCVCAAVSVSQVELALLRPPLSGEGSKRAEENRSWELAAVCSGLADGSAHDSRGKMWGKLILPFQSVALSEAVNPCSPGGRWLT